MRHKQQVAARVRKLKYTWNQARDVCLLCGKNWLHACSSHTQEDNLAALATIRQEDNA